MELSVQKVPLVTQGPQVTRVPRDFQDPEEQMVPLDHPVAKVLEVTLVMRDCLEIQVHLDK